MRPNKQDPHAGSSRVVISSARVRSRQRQFQALTTTEAAQRRLLLTGKVYDFLLVFHSDLKPNLGGTFSCRGIIPDDGPKKNAARYNCRAALAT